MQCAAPREALSFTASIPFNGETGVVKPYFHSIGLRFFAPRISAECNDGYGQDADNKIERVPTHAISVPLQSQRCPDMPLFSAGRQKKVFGPKCNAGTYG